jgi:hypothetical protein
MGRLGIAACAIVSQRRQENAGRTWRITSNRPGM